MVHLSQCLWRGDSRGSLLLAEVFEFKISIIGSSLELYKTKILSKVAFLKNWSKYVSHQNTKTCFPQKLHQTFLQCIETFLSRVDRMTANMAGRFSSDLFFKLLKILLAGFHQTCCGVCPSGILPYFPLSVRPSVNYQLSGWPTKYWQSDKVNKKHSAPGKNTEYRAIWKNLRRVRQTFAKRWTFTLERDVASRRGRPRTLKQTVGIDLILVIISVILFTISMSM